MSFLFRSLLFIGGILALSTVASQAQANADFFFELSNGPGKMVAPIKVDFVNASSGEDLQYNWTLDGVSFSTAEEPSRLFLKGGKYKICLEVNKEAIKDQQCQHLEFFDPLVLPALAQSSKR